MKIIKIIVVIALVLVALALGAQNQEVVTFNYLLAKGDFHLSILLGIVFATGVALSALAFGSIQLKYKLTIRRLNKQLKKYQPKIDAKESKA
ncbi:lipopolysaccharide assembly protein LapA domain-containing protein [Vibrio tapetis subsp. quintayensis]|uniref:LapA family protein n=1 Tax=Vibrio tapetis TaxID=52443 RepID=UPI0025B47BC8|nr:lipopolysaccharide assembly protein LapA domain-containing protein [Vibrio tapetis]MDN3682338.1 lipopolysaccharide assembly protein LapA domain-containing protein [Vibrio tapetis subsp. quintayensis]